MMIPVFLSKLRQWVESVQRIDRKRIHPGVQFLFLLGVILLVLFIRRPLQFIHPDVWVEDGTVFIPDSLTYGFAGILRPINGYLIVLPRFINWLSLQISLEWYPQISTFFGVLINIATFFSVILFPTVLIDRVFCALAIFLIPIYPEVYILPSYSFWMCSVILIVLLLWHPEAQSINKTIFRSLVLILCGLSTPFMVFLSPLFLLRAWIIKNWHEFSLLVIATGVSFAHLLTAVTTLKQPTQLSLQDFNLDFFKAIAIKFFGYYLVSPVEDRLAFDLSLLLIIYLTSLLICLFVGIRFGKIHNPAMQANQLLLLLYFVLIAAIFSSIARLPLFMPHPLFAGPRYFFLSFVVISWILLNPPIVANSLYQWLKGVGTLLVLVAFINTLSPLSHLIWWQESLDWRSSVAEYRSKGTAMFLVHFDGKISHAWYLRLQQPVVK
ncbi:hypothetical protein ACN4EK_29690 [Pantanalinema rosaneae CENA516]|uniref:hypothetical protein n=1 Tax=Pantanalinema rosaneae TaxID=1620701 RepID=UPI003D6E9F2E